MKLLFRLVLLLSFVQLNEYTGSCYGPGHDYIGNLLYYSGSASLQIEHHFNATHSAFRTTNRKLKATFNEEEDEDDSKSFRSKKEKNLFGQHTFNKDFNTAHSLAVLSRALLQDNYPTCQRHYYPSCKMHVLHQVFRI